MFLVGELGLGGSERQLYLLLKNMPKDGLRIVVVVFNPSSNEVLDDAIRDLGIEVIPIPRSIRGLWGRSRFLFRLFREASPHVLHSWTVHDNPYAGIIGWLARVPVRWGSLRGSTNLRGFQSLPKAYRWLSLHSVQKLQVNAVSIRDELIGSGYPQEKIELLLNCTADPADHTPADLTVYGVRHGEPVIGTVGNLRSVKNHEMFIDAMARVLRQRPETKALIVGQRLPSEASVYDDLTKRIDVHGLQNRIVLTGFQSDVPGLLKTFSVFCLTSRSEGTPNAVLEAMAGAIPVVATRVGGIPHLIEDGVNGFLVESGDAENMASNVIALLDDSAKADRVGQAGRQTVLDNHSCDSKATLLLQHYHDELDRLGKLPT
ncbi:MAG: glycosyltransferase [Thermoanaerobaculia bacterium]|nr:glycosyltransferase [Thermoanaerobaculia bacterium]